MSYTKKVWKTGDTITADAMNNIENSVEESSELYDVSYSDTFTWDGNTEGLEYFSVDTTKYHLVSQDINSVELFDDEYSVFIRTYDQTVEEDATAMMPINNIADNVYAFGEGVILVTKDNCMIEVDENEFVTVPKKGLYTYDLGTIYISKIVFPGKNVIKNIEIKSKHLPKTYTKYSVTFIDEYLYHYGTDTTNVENRVTRIELSDALENKNILLELSDEASRMIISPILVEFNEEQDFGMVHTLIAAQNVLTFFTAEYTAS